MEENVSVTEQLYNRRAADELALRGAAVVESLLWVLRHDTSIVHRRNAAYVLGRIGNRRALETLIWALKSDEALVREDAAEALGYIGGPRAIRPLILALGDATAVVRRSVVRALSQMGEPALEPLMQELWSPRPGVHESVLATLRQIGAPAVPPLIKLLKYASGGVRKDAAAVLEHLGNAQTLPRKVLADTRLSVPQRIEALEFLLPYYKRPDLRRFCEQAAQEKSGAVREGAKAALSLLDSRTLVRPIAKSQEEDRRELLRAAEHTMTSEPPETLLRPTERDDTP